MPAIAIPVAPARTRRTRPDALTTPHDISRLTKVIRLWNENGGRAISHEACRSLLSRLGLTHIEVQLLSDEVLRREERGENPWTPLQVAAILQSYRAYLAALAAPPVTDDPALCPVCGVDLLRLMTCQCKRPEDHLRDEAGQRLPRRVQNSIDEVITCDGALSRQEVGGTHLYHIQSCFWLEIGEAASPRELHFFRDGMGLKREGMGLKGSSTGINGRSLLLMYRRWSTSAPSPRHLEAERTAPTHSQQESTCRLEAEPPDEPVGR